MVQAILNGTKTETRRLKGLDLINKNPRNWRYDGLDDDLGYQNNHWFETVDTDNNPIEGYNYVKCPYGKAGDVIWVRETWAPALNEICYKADYSSEVLAEDRNKGLWKPSIHMPKAAARIWLQVESIHCERLQSITDGGAIAEGIEIVGFNYWKMPLYKHYTSPNAIDCFSTPYDSYMSLWESINGSESWNKNPWVWVIKFKVLSTTGKPQNLN